MRKFLEYTYNLTFSEEHLVSAFRIMGIFYSNGGMSNDKMKRIWSLIFNIAYSNIVDRIQYRINSIVNVK